MIATTWARWLCAVGLLAMASIHAATADEDADEARIGAQMQARLAAAPVAAAGAAVTLALAPAPEPAPVIAEVIAPAPPSADDDWLAPPPPPNEGLPFAQLAGRIGHKVAIVTVGERVHRGTVTAASAREVTLQVRRPGGTATYTLRREQILRIDAR